VLSKTQKLTVCVVHIYLQEVLKDVFIVLSEQIKSSGREWM